LASEQKKPNSLSPPGSADPSARLEEREETLEMILDNLGEGVLATDLEGKPIFANPEAREILDLGEERPPRRLPDYLGDCDLREMIARCARRRECNERLVHGDDTLFRVKFDHLPKFDSHRGGVLIMIRDLSEGRRLEMNQQRFLANAAHELKTPITTIVGAAELLLTGADEDPETRRRFLEHILSEGRRMQRLSETLLGLARIGAERREPDLQSVDPEAVARRAAERIEPLAQSAEVELRVELRRDSRVRADPEQLEQVLLALLSNAVQHSKRGGKVWLWVDGGKLAVEDEGSGIDSEDLPHLFERFFRGKGSAGGFGLGLSICRDLVEGMGGRISLRSREAEGTAAEVRLPEAGA
jgi:two-component system phosphate regulon sensor histidine kinase PhoR